MNRKTKIIIPVRLNSTRFPGKALVSVGNQSHIEKLLSSIKVWHSKDDIYVATDSKAIAFVVKKAGFNVLTTGPADNGTARIAQGISVLELSDEDWVLNVQGDLVEISSETGQQLLDTLSQADTAKANWVTYADRKGWNQGSLNENSGSVWIEINQVGYGTMFGRKPNPELSVEGNSFHSHIGLYAYKRSVLEKYLTLNVSSNEESQKLEQFRLLDSGIFPYVGFLDNVPTEINTEEDFIRQFLMP